MNIEKLKSEREPVIVECKGCERIELFNKIGYGIHKVCNAYISPTAKWRIGICPLATHVKIETTDNKRKIRAGQQKQKKKGK